MNIWGFNDNLEPKAIRLLFMILINLRQGAQVDTNPSGSAPPE